jgi:hypothetical protein
MSNKLSVHLFPSVYLNLSIHLSVHVYLCVYLSLCPSFLMKDKNGVVKLNIGETFLLCKLLNVDTENKYKYLKYFLTISLWRVQFKMERNS